MKIGIDCRLAGLKNAGIGRYISNLITRLPKLAPKTDWVFFFHNQDQIDEVFPELPKNVCAIITPIKHYTLEEQIRLPQLFAAHSLDLLHVPHFNAPVFYSGKMIVTIHDLLWHQQKGSSVTTLNGWQYWLKYLGYRAVVNQAIAKAQTILVPANTIKQTVAKRFPQSESKIIVTKEGVDQSLTAKKLPTTKPSKNLLYVGSLYPHKNVKRVIDALTALPDYKLQIVGSRSVFQDEIKHCVKQKGVSDQVEFLGFVPDAELQKLYHSAFALVQPSLSEGFGLTGLEAMAAGGAVIASDIPIFKEIYQNAAILFDPNSTKSFIEAVHTLEKTDRKKLHQHSLKLLKAYSWDQMAEQTLAAYKKSIS